MVVAKLFTRTTETARRLVICDLAVAVALVLDGSCGVCETLKCPLVVWVVVPLAPVAVAPPWSTKKRRENAVFVSHFGIHIGAG